MCKMPVSGLGSTFPDLVQGALELREETPVAPTAKVAKPMMVAMMPELCPPWLLIIVCTMPAACGPTVLLNLA